jgi:hypothetical protein
MTDFQTASYGFLDLPAKADLSSAQRLPGFSSLWTSGPKSSPDRKVATAAPSYALPINLPIALKYLDNSQLDRLLAAVLAEQQLRGGKKPLVRDSPYEATQIKKAAPSLAQGKLNAIRAAFKAGITASRIARQFGISLSDVKAALASNPSK